MTNGEACHAHDSKPDFKEHSTILGIAPFWCYQDTIRHIPVTRIGFISCSDTPHVDLIVSDRRREEVLNAVINHLFVTKRHVWDVLTLRQWPSESKNYLALQQSISQLNKKFNTKTASQTPYILLDADWEQFLHSRSARFRKTRRNIINKLTKFGNIDIQCVRLDDDGKWLKEVFGITEKSWKYQEGDAIACMGHMRQFFEALTKIAGEKGWLLIWLLRIDGKPVAMEYDLVADGQVYALRADFDEAYSDYSPGTYLGTEILQQLFKDPQYEVYNTGPGMNLYKLQLTDKSTENIVLTIFNDNLKGRMVYLVENHAVPILKYIRKLVYPEG